MGGLERDVLVGVGVTEGREDVVRTQQYQRSRTRDTVLKESIIPSRHCRESGVARRHGTSAGVDTRVFIPFTLTGTFPCPTVRPQPSQALWIDILYHKCRPMGLVTSLNGRNIDILGGTYEVDVGSYTDVPLIRWRPARSLPQEVMVDVLSMSQTG